MFCVTGANRPDSMVFEQLVDALPAIAGRRGRPRHRWGVERTHAWLAAFGKLRMRFERRIDSHLAFLALACRIICLRTLMRFC